MPVGIFSQNLYDKGQQGLEGLPGAWCAAEVVEEPGTGSPPTFCPGWVLTAGSDLTEFLLSAAIISTSVQNSSSNCTVSSHIFQ